MKRASRAAQHNTSTIRGADDTGRCMFCGNATEPGEYGEHAACRAEYNRRRGSGRCTRCGSGAGSDIWCPDCAVVGGQPFRGYPGGA